MNFSSDNIIAYFQPILSADSKAIYSFEVLGRYVDDDGSVKSLGPFFHDPNTSHEEALRIDLMVKRYAMKKYAEEKRNEYLFINIRLAWLDQYIGRPEELPMFQWAREFGISLDRIVIEITEEEFYASDAHVELIPWYKNAGCRIALDDYGKESSDIDRLAKLQPDIIKINTDYVHKSADSYHYREYLQSLASFAEAVGIEVLYEGIETPQELAICLTTRGRFYQGYLIAYPQASMNNAMIDRHIFSTSTKDAYNALQNRIMHEKAFSQSLNSRIEGFLLENPLDIEEINIDEYLSALFSMLPDVKRIFLCDKQGEQISSNIEWVSGAITRRDYRGKNWAWRGYFHEAMEAYIAGRKSCLSTAYRDFTTKQRIFTYFYALRDDTFLFVDIDWFSDLL